MHVDFVTNNPHSNVNPIRHRQIRPSRHMLVVPPQLLHLIFLRPANLFKKALSQELSQTFSVTRKPLRYLAAPQKIFDTSVKYLCFVERRVSAIVALFESGEVVPVLEGQGNSGLIELYD
jgi:hypothetical protein